MEKTINGFNYGDWVIRVGGWGIPDEDLMRSYKRKRLPLPDDLKEKRRLHMIDMRAKGYPVSWIAKMYGISRMQVTRIIRGLANN